jgi:hypothetical protein
VLELDLRPALFGHELDLDLLRGLLAAPGMPGEGEPMRRLADGDGAPETLFAVCGDFVETATDVVLEDNALCVFAVDRVPTSEGPPGRNALGEEAKGFLRGGEERLLTW